MPRMTALHMLRSTISTVSAPANSSFRGSITHPTQPLCTLRVRRYRRLTQHSLPGDLLGLTWAGLAPADRASFARAFTYSITSSAMARGVVERGTWPTNLASWGRFITRQALHSSSKGGRACRAALALIKRSAVAVATSREDHHSPTAGQAVQHPRWDRERRLREPSLRIDQQVGPVTPSIGDVTIGASLREHREAAIVKKPEADMIGAANGRWYQLGDAGPPATSSEIRTPGLAFPLRSNVRKSVADLRLRNALEGIFMSKKAAEHHKKASEHHTHAARHHAEAAKYHEAGNHEKAAHHAHTARGHVAHARGHAEEAAKAHAEEYGKKSGP